ncbi:MAG: type IV secretion system DNA-binding domain-containing protein [Candidatus Cardinium sp.]
MIGYQLFFYLHLLYLNDIVLIPDALATFLSYCIAVQHNWMVNSLYVLCLLHYQYDKVIRLIERLKQKWHFNSLLILGWTVLFCCYVMYYPLLWVKGSFHIWLYPLLFALVTFLIPFSNDEGHFQLINPTKRKNREKSITLPAYNGQLPINNPQRGIYILGNQGSGKTRYVLEPILYALIKKGYAGIIYDYDFEGRPPDHNYCLTKFAFNCFLQFCDATKFQFHSINFTSLRHSIRINPIAPRYILNRAYLEEYTSVLLHNLAPDKKDDFWNLSTKALLKGMIVFLANRRPRCCTLPHVLALATKPIASILQLIEKDDEAASYASSILDAFKGGEKTAGQLVGVIATFKTNLQILLNKDLFWVLSRDDLDLTINDSEKPTILCIGNHPSAKSAFSPVISLLLTVCFKAMYGHNRTKSFVAIDELPTLFIPELAELPATARKYGISTVACLQSNAQLEHTYGSIGAKRIQDTLVNKIIGNVEGASADWASHLMGKKEKKVVSSSSSTSHYQSGRTETAGEGTNLQEKSILSPQDFMDFKVGTFAGRVVESNQAFFKYNLKKVSSFDKKFENQKLKDLKESHQYVDIKQNFKKIYQEVDILIGKNS